MRDKLIELVRNAPRTDVVYGDIKLSEPCQTVRTIVDHLLDHGVVVLPVKPGDTVYTISRGKIKEWTVYYVGMNTIGHFMFDFHDKDCNNSRSACEADLGDVVFLTEEDAINELKERNSYNEHKTNY